MDAKRNIPETWKEFLTDVDRHDGWGLYFPYTSDEPLIFAKGLEIETFVDEKTGVILAAKIYMCGAKFWIVLGKPDSPLTFGHYRPRGMIIDTSYGDRRFDFLWLHKTKDYVELKSTGDKTDRNPDSWYDWKPAWKF
ncbi:hypothetical protein P775_28520 [Puniceibacterium antarcticum]|uniref:Uncharacterized protein n=2 Tax=Puniceibacterium antarcticum TaxID=1206336 RepID=A0A2G8QT27_9RHOB|nr:hypothetical protein P775_28520 [Puniceibacterium antarcticum]